MMHIDTIRGIKAAVKKYGAPVVLGAIDVARVKGKTGKAAWDYASGVLIRRSREGTSQR